MDMIAGAVTMVLLIFLDRFVPKIKVPKKLNTALLGGFMVFVILTKRIDLIEQKIGIILVALLLIFAVNLEIKKPEDDHSELQAKDKPKKS
jgi:hypothetical protein